MSTSNIAVMQCLFGTQI